MPATMQVEPYLFFDGRCEEALEFYRAALGAEVTALMRGKDSPDPTMVQPGGENKVIHARVRIGETMLMASDGRCEGRPTFQGFALSLTSASETEAERLFAALLDGGQVQMPLAKTFFSPRFGMVADRFGVSWMIYVAPAGEARSEALARRFEAKAQEALATLEGLGDADWKKVTAAEKWSVGVTAHHVAGVLVPISYIIKAVAAGERLPGGGLDRIDEMNARHAQEFASCTKAETVELLRQGVPVAAAAIRALSDAELDRTGVLAPGMPPMSTEQIVTGGLLNHIDEHVGSVRKTVGH